MSQCTQLLSTASLAMPSDLWVPVTRHIRPMKSFQYAVGVYYTGIKNWEFSIEGYYKDMYNVLEYKDGESFLGSSHNWEDKVEMGKGRSFGVEFMAQKLQGSLLDGLITPYPNLTGNSVRTGSIMVNISLTNMTADIP